MKKLIGLSLLAVTFLFAGSVSAQNRQYQNPQDRNWEYNQRQDRGRHEGWRKHRDFNQVYVTYRVRYVQYFGQVYKETWRFTENRFGQVLSRELVKRERVRNYDRNRNGFKFNVFLRF